MRATLTGIIAALLLTLAGCGGAAQPEAAPAAPATTEAPSPTPTSMTDVCNREPKTLEAGTEESYATIPCVGDTFTFPGGEYEVTLNYEGIVTLADDGYEIMNDVPRPGEDALNYSLTIRNTSGMPMDAETLNAPIMSATQCLYIDSNNETQECIRVGNLSTDGPGQDRTIADILPNSTGTDDLVYALIDDAQEGMLSSETARETPGFSRGEVRAVSDETHGHCSAVVL